MQYLYDIWEFEIQSHLVHLDSFFFDIVVVSRGKATKKSVSVQTLIDLTVYSMSWQTFFSGRGLVMARDEATRK